MQILKKYTFKNNFVSAGKETTVDAPITNNSHVEPKQTVNQNGWYFIFIGFKKNSDR